MSDGSLYKAILGDAYEILPAAVRRMHDGSVTTAFGTAKVTQGSSLVARLASFFMGFPETGDGVPVFVTFEHGEGREVWHRTFANRRFRSIQAAGTGRDTGMLVEIFGPVASTMEATVSDQGLTVIPIRTRVFGLPLPAALAPKGHGIEHERDGLFSFDVRIEMLGSMIVTYVGTLSRSNDLARR